MQQGKSVAPRIPPLLEALWECVGSLAPVFVQGCEDKAMDSRTPQELWGWKGN